MISNRTCKYLYGKIKERGENFAIIRIDLMETKRS